jgi:hypothetical protein
MVIVSLAMYFCSTSTIDEWFTLVTTVPTKKSSIQSGDRILEINGVGYLDFKSAKKANELFDMLILDVIPADEEDEEEEDDEEEESSEDEELD